MSKDKSKLSELVKSFEIPSTKRIADKNDYLILRLDGKNFSNFCSSMNKPFDVRMQETMKEVLLNLMKSFRPFIGYTQSDEISS